MLFLCCQCHQIRGSRPRGEHSAGQPATAPRERKEDKNAPQEVRHALLSVFCNVFVYIWFRTGIILLLCIFIVDMSIHQIHRSIPRKTDGAKLS